MELEQRTINYVRMQEKVIRLGFRTERSTVANNNGQRQ